MAQMTQFYEHNKALVDTFAGMPGVFAKSTRAVKAGVLACLASNQQFYAHMPVVHKLPAVALAMPAAPASSVRTCRVVGGHWAATNASPPVTLRSC